MNFGMILSEIWKLWLSDWILSFVIGFFVFLWLWSVLWVIKDISARTDSLFLQTLSIFLMFLLTPVLWLPLYFLIRPIFYKYDKNGWKEALALQTIVCRDCWSFNLSEFNNCIACWSSLKIECKECKNKYSSNWDYCQKCWAPNIENE